LSEINITQQELTKLLEDFITAEIYIYDIDFTTDYKGELKYNTFKNINGYEVLDNNKFLGNNQITFKTQNNHRLKFYSKTICNIETSSVRDNFGT
jgi:hypothetical protein